MIFQIFLFVPFIEQLKKFMLNFEIFGSFCYNLVIFANFTEASAEAQ